MPFDPQTHQQRILAHYVSLAGLAPWRPYVKARVQEMAKDCPEMYGSLEEQIRAALLAKSSSVPKKTGG